MTSEDERDIESESDTGGHINGQNGETAPVNGLPWLHVESLGVSWTAWCTSNTWQPPMFNSDGSLRVGEGGMGGFVKDWLYERRTDNQPTK